MPTERTISVAEAITSVHETGHARPNYACIARLPDGPGGALQVTFGAHQSTDRADSLDKIVARFRDLAMAEYGAGWEGHTLADELAAYLPRLAQNTAASCRALARDSAFGQTLAASAGEPLMHTAQKAIFREGYMDPVVAACERSGFVEPLTLALLYDIKIHGALEATLKRVPAMDERPWAKRVAEVRRANLADAGRPGSFFHNPILRNTVYRMDTFLRAIAADNWSLATPVVAHGVTIREEDLAR